MRSKRQIEKDMQAVHNSWGVYNSVKDDRVDIYYNFLKKRKEIFGNFPLMWADCKILIKSSADAKDPRFVEEYHGYPYEDHTHHIVCRTKGGYDISVNKIDLYTGLAVIEKEVV